MSIEDLRAEADELGIKYSPNIGEAKLQAKIDEFKANGTQEEDLSEFMPKENKRVVPEEESKEVKFAKKLRETKAKKLKRSKVIVYNNDPRESDFSTTMSRVQNSYFGNARVIPIGQEWWLEQMHIDNLKSVEILTYVKDPKTGNMMAKKQKKFTVDILDTDEAAALANARTENGK